ncbi:MAG: hypothetical protein K0U98_20480 [Deltaproteobacteria bacterium]|nr:hypothetical protein [Deltaproteobacteria bacterium]
MLTSQLPALALPALLALTPQQLWQAWPEERFIATPAPCLKPAELERSLEDLAAKHSGRLTLEEVGRSFLDRPIYLLTVGRGPHKVMLWSQMHGDEPSATPALLDLADYLLSHSSEPTPRAILEGVTLLIIPMLNPDGSEVYQRRNAQDIDINRDALNLATPEGRLLKQLRDTYEPLLGFNLHDQNRRTAVGNTGRLATNAVLAVAGDEAGTLTPGRARAKRACAGIIKTLAPFMPGGMARYDEDWSPRAFGDNLTAWGTPVVLIESGGLPPGQPMTELTRLNFVALLTSLEDLVTNDFGDHDPQLYESLPRNQSDAWVDVAVRGGKILQPETATPYRADLVFNRFQDDRVDAGCPVPAITGSRIMEIGDGRFLSSSHEVNASGKLIVSPWTVTVEGFKARRWLSEAVLLQWAHLGVGTVLWKLPPRHQRAAEGLAKEWGRPEGSRLEIVPEASPGVGAQSGMTLTRPPEIPSELTLSAIFEALGPEAGPKKRPHPLPAEGSLKTWERILWPRSATLPGRVPSLRRGRPASFLVLSPPTGQAGGFSGSRLDAVWLDGVEIPMAGPSQESGTP